MSPQFLLYALRYVSVGKGLRVLFSLFFLAGWCQVSADHIDDGRSLLEQGEYLPALNAFRSALVEDPENPEAAFYVGVALNREGLFREAYSVLSLVYEAAYPHPELMFELGWSAYRTGRVKEAIDFLENYERLIPGRGQAAEFLGRAYLDLGDFPKARRYLNEALARDPSLAPTVRLALARLAGASADPNEAFRQMSKVSQEAPNNALTQLYAKRAEPRAGQEQRAWKLSTSVKAGYNSNVIAIGEGIPLPVDISDESSAILSGSLNFEYALLRTQRDRITLGWFSRLDRYENEFSDSNLFLNAVNLQWTRRLNEKSSFRIRLDDTYSRVGSASLSNRISLAPSFTYKLTEKLTMDLSYRLSATEYLKAASPITDRDGFNQNFGVSFYFPVGESKVTGYAGYNFSLVTTDGSDYDAKNHNVFIGARAPLFWDITSSLSYARVWSRYDNLNSFTGFLQKRSDDIDSVSLSFSKPLSERTQFELSYALSNSDSNINFYQYDQHVILSGMTFKW